MPLMHPSKAALECCIVASGLARSDAAPRPAWTTPRSRAGVRAPSRDPVRRRARLRPAGTPPAHAPGRPGRPALRAIRDGVPPPRRAASGRRLEARPC